jgi:hypothetical protein
MALMPSTDFKEVINLEFVLLPRFYFGKCCNVTYSLFVENDQMFDHKNGLVCFLPPSTFSEMILVP